MIRIKNVSKNTILKNINLTFPNKSFISIIGDSGSGKSTLIKIISGLEKPSKGKVFLNDKRLIFRNKDKIRALSIGLVLQDSNLDLDKTVYENIELSLKVINLKEKYERKEKVDYIIKALNLQNLKNSLCKNLSGGEKKRVELARALVKNPDVIIADEITSSLDNKNAKMVLDILKSISEEKLVILVTHNIKEALMYSKRIIQIKNGTIYKDSKNNKENKFIYNKINLDYLDNSLNDIKYSSIYKFNDLIISILKSLIKNKTKKKYLIGLFISTSILYLSLCMYSAKINYSKPNIYDKNYIRVLTKNKSFLEQINASYYIKGHYIKRIYLKNDNFYKLNKPLIEFKSSIKKRGKVKLSCVWIDKSLIKILFDDKKVNSLLKMENIPNDLKGVSIIINNVSFKVEKVVSLNSPSIYINNNDFNRILLLNSKYQDYNRFKDYLTITSGREPIYDGEVLIKEGTISNLDVVGTYKENYDYIFVNKDTFEKKYYNSNEYSIYTKNKSSTIKKLKKLNIKYIDDYSILQEHNLRVKKQKLTVGN